jgi:hypothetical protein
MTEVNTGGDISRENLARHGIIYDPRVYQVPKASAQSTSFALPDHIDAVREALLEFDNTIPEDWKEYLCEDFTQFVEQFGRETLGPAWSHQPPTSAFIPLKLYERNRLERSSDWTKADENIKRFEAVAKSAQGLLEDAEQEWNRFWRSSIFMSFTDEAYEQNSYM